MCWCKHKHWVQQFKQEKVEETSLFDKARSGRQQDRIKKLVKRWQKCIEVGGDYVEK
jgi:hypothetical protein